MKIKVQVDITVDRRVTEEETTKVIFDFDEEEFREEYVTFPNREALSRAILDFINNEEDAFYDDIEYYMDNRPYSYENYTSFIDNTDTSLLEEALKDMIVEGCCKNITTNYCPTCGAKIDKNGEV